MSETIGTAYIQIVPSTDGIGNSISSALNKEAGTAGKSAGSTLSSTLGSAAKVGATAVAGLGTAIAGVGTALASSASSVASYGDNIDKASQKMGVSSEFYQKWDAVLQHSGTSMSAMTSTFKTLSNVASDTTSSQAEALAKLGLSAEDLGGTSEEAFTTVITALQGMENGTERAAIAQDLLGKGATELGALFNTSTEDTQAMLDTVEALGGVMSEDAVAGSAAFEDSLQDLQTAFTGIKNNAMGELLPGISTVMQGLTGLMTGSEDAGTQLQEGMTSITENITALMPQIATTFSTLATSIMEVAPQVLQSLGEGLITAIPEIIPALTEMVTSMASTIIELLPQLIECGLQVIVQLALGIAEALPDLIPTIVEVVLEIVDTLIDNIDLLVEASVAIIVGLAEGLITALPELIERAPEIITKLVAALIKEAPAIAKAGLQLMTLLGKALLSNISTVLTKVASVAKQVINKFTTGFKSITNIGKNIVTGLWNGISGKVTWLKNKISGFCSSALNAIKDFFGIHSPSKVMAEEVGQYIPAGIAKGIDSNSSIVQTAMEDLVNDLLIGGGTIENEVAETSTVSVDQEVTANVDLTELMDVLNKYLKYLPDMANMEMYVDGSAFVGATAVKMNKALGKLAKSTKKGVQVVNVAVV